MCMGLLDFVRCWSQQDREAGSRCEEDKGACGTCSKFGQRQQLLRAGHCRSDNGKTGSGRFEGPVQVGINQKRDATDEGKCNHASREVKR
jgi:hypothetical protein